MVERETIVLAVLIHKELKDPRLGMVTINDVRVSKDLAYAEVFFTVFPDDHAEEAGQLLRNASSFLRKLLARQLRKATQRIGDLFLPIFASKSWISLKQP